MHPMHTLSGVCTNHRKGAYLKAKNDILANHKPSEKNSKKPENPHYTRPYGLLNKEIRTPTLYQSWSPYLYGESVADTI